MRNILSCSAADRNEYYDTCMIRGSSSGEEKRGGEEGEEEGEERREERREER